MSTWDTAPPERSIHLPVMCDEVVERLAPQPGDVIIDGTFGAGGYTTALLAAGSLAVLIGGSRLYLIEHFLSDVVNGWIVGALWLVIGLGMGERRFGHAQRVGCAFLGPGPERGPKAVRGQVAPAHAAQQHEHGPIGQLSLIPL